VKPNGPSAAITAALECGGAGVGNPGRPGRCSAPHRAHYLRLPHGRRHRRPNRRRHQGL